MNGLFMGWRFSRMDGWTTNGVWCLLIHGLEVGMEVGMEVEMERENRTKTKIEVRGRR